MSIIGGIVSLNVFILSWLLSCLCESVFLAAALRIWLAFPSTSFSAYMAFLTKNIADLFIFMQKIL